METPNMSFLVLFFMSLAVMIPTLQANVAEDDGYWTQRSAEFDEYWKQKAEEAQKAALDAYHSDPLNVTNQVNSQVEIAITGSNSTRRNLRGRGGKCEATNPIDRCWRCDPNWSNNRQKLADCVLGFGRKATGGKGGKLYIVTDASDDDMLNPKPGTLRHAVIQKEPLWIIFSRSMVIKLKQELIVASNKTIDGRGVNVHIAYGCGITLQFIQNIIIHGLRIHDISTGAGGLIRDSVDHYGFRTQSDGDGISLFGASNIWIDHVSMSRCSDGLIDAIMASSGITISNSHFTDHNEVMLFGASDAYSGDKVLQVTLAFNHFGKGLVQRMPRCRWGFFHIINNDYTNWLMYAIGGSQGPTVISEGNRFIAPENSYAKEVTKREYATPDQWKNWNWISRGDLMVNGAFFVQSGNPASIQQFSRYDVIKSKAGTYANRLTRYSGALDCFVGKPC